MKISSKGLTDLGKARTNNEDNFGIYDEYNLYIVADGMGGHNAGEVASKIVVDTIYKYFKDNFKNLKSKEEPDEFIKKAIKMANREVYNRAQKNQEEAGMGTTVTVIFLYEKKAYIGWVGDSRVYISRYDLTESRRLLSQITTDHSLIEEQIANNIITREEAEEYEIKDIITKAVGFSPEVEPDCNILKELKSDDIFMACSDGYYRYFKPIEIANAFVKVDFEDLAKYMIDQALESGGEDNITVATIKIDKL
jgi:protein phosphatase